MSTPEWAVDCQKARSGRLRRPTRRVPQRTAIGLPSKVMPPSPAMAPHWLTAGNGSRQFVRKMFRSGAEFSVNGMLFRAGKVGELGNESGGCRAGEPGVQIEIKQVKDKRKLDRRKGGMRRHPEAAVSDAQGLIDYRGDCAHKDRSCPLSSRHGEHMRIPDDLGAPIPPAGFLGSVGVRHVGNRSGFDTEGGYAPCCPASFPTTVVETSGMRGMGSSRLAEEHSGELPTDLSSSCCCFVSKLHVCVQTMSAQCCFLAGTCALPKPTSARNKILMVAPA